MSTVFIAHPPALISLEVVHDRGLRIVVEERTGLGPAVEQFDLGIKGSEIIATEGDKTYEIWWPVVVCFAVRGDPFPAGGPSTATISDIGTDSSFLRWVQSESYAEVDYVAAMGDGREAGRVLRQWTISSSEARIDVAALDPPLIRTI